MRLRSARKLLRTTACGVSSSSPAIRSGSMADSTKSSGRPSALARALRQDCASSGVSARAAVSRTDVPSAPIDSVAARLGERRQRRRRDRRRSRRRAPNRAGGRAALPAISTASRRPGRTLQRPRRRVRFASRPWRRRASLSTSARAAARAAARCVSASAAAGRKTSSRASARWAASASAASRSADRLPPSPLPHRRGAWPPPRCRSSMIVDHRAEQEAAQNPDEDEDVDRLQAPASTSRSASGRAPT